MAIKAKLSTNVLWPIVILLITLAAFYFKPWQAKNVQTVSVTAEGKALAKPDIAQITAAIESKNPNLDTARAENEKLVSGMVEKLKNLGIKEEDIKTQNISAAPGFQTQTMIYPRPIQSTTNIFSTSVTITIRNFEIADNVIAALTQNGATNLYGPNLTLSDSAKETAKSTARQNAFEQAQKKAEELAKLSGRKIGKAVNIKESGEPIYPVPLMAQGGADLMQKASQIQPGQNEVTVNLSVDFSLK